MLGTEAYRPLLAKMLDKIGAYSDADSGSVEERCFHLGCVHRLYSCTRTDRWCSYQLFSMLFHQGLQGTLFTILSRSVPPLFVPTAPLTPRVARTNRLHHHRRPFSSF